MDKRLTVVIPAYKALSTIEEGYMTGDLAALSNPPAKQILNSWEFIAAIRERLEKLL